MKKRPISITIIAWWMIAGSAFGLFTLPHSFNYLLPRLATSSKLIMGIESIIIVGSIFAFINLIFGIFILRRAHWARISYAVFALVGLIFNVMVNAVHHPLNLVFFIVSNGVIIYLLFAPPASSYFKATVTFREILSTLFYIVVGIFLFFANFTAFLKHDSVVSVGVKIVIFLFPSAVLFLIGSWVCKFVNWRTVVGVTSILASFSAAFGALLMHHFYYTIEHAQSITTSQRADLLAFFSQLQPSYTDYLFGTIYMALTFVVAVIFIRSNKQAVPSLMQ